MRLSFKVEFIARVEKNNRRKNKQRDGQDKVEGPIGLHPGLDEEAVQPDPNREQGGSDEKHTARPRAAPPHAPQQE